MIEFLTGAVFVGFLASTIRLAVPLIFASLGEVFTQRSGILNLGLEGIMLIGSFIGFTAANLSGNLWVGVLAGMLSGLMIAIVIAVFDVTLGADQTIVGIMIVIAAQGLVTYLNNVIYKGGYVPPRIGGFTPIRIPLLADIPVIGDTFFNQNILVYIAFLLVPLFAVVLFKTTWGLRVRGVGEDPRSADAMGVNVFRTRYLALLFGGMMAGLGGAFLTLGYLGTFNDNITAGRGWIAIALVYFGQWNPYRVLAGALLFGGVNALQLRLQAQGANLPFQFMLMLPYVLTILVLIGISREGRGPAALCVPYRREVRT
ncbi:MAG: ABC transporter permease [Chloroflexi bacterium]|nr:ABC transporter permease [Chloroflexota bacterium]